MIDLRRLHVLRVVHQLGTVTAAARALHLTPSAVSQQLRQLAHELEVPLLEPDGRRVRLTPAAHTLLGHADDLAARWERARGDLHADTVGAAMSLRLAGFTSSLRTLVVPAVEDLHAHRPEITVRVLEVETAEAFGRVLTGDIDIAVTLPHQDGPPLDDPRFEQHPLLDEPQDLLLPRRHRLAERTSVALEEAAQEPWVLPAPGTCDHHEITTAACAAAGFTPKAAHEAMDWSAVATLVAAGLGVCLKPRFVPVPAELAVVAVPLAGPTAPQRRILTCTRRGSRSQPHIARGLAALRTAAHAARGAGPAERLRPVG
ncbi:LysR family transcriptional regulator [Pseudonocardia kunmingensis]|uniref:DNA-binding transcriptional LysR family regulator n=1 Tax=Pseudonocardia kunmingensis TaxID=630975 RepID=A0A543DIV4_9PSEU|nr:LysR family transcriptional regulator [Pseudonocardia kunmingensis]TQM09185.1 DNA-binding transcriptional LysR family regulator [Pseudonocardia kunmingensis]